MIYVITDPNKVQLFMTAANTDFEVQTMGQSRLLVVKHGDLQNVFRAVKEKTGVQLDNPSSSLVFLTDGNDISSLTVDEMASVSVSGSNPVVPDENKTIPFGELSDDAFNVLAALALVDDSGVNIDYDEKLVTIASSAGLPLETVLTKQKSVVTEDVKDQTGNVVGERVTETEQYVPVTVPTSDVIKEVESREQLDPTASSVVSLNSESKSDWYKKFIVGVAGVSGLLVLTLFLSGLAQDFAASKIRKGSTNRIYITIAKMGSLRHRKKGGIVYDSNSDQPADINALFYNVNVIRSLNIVGIGFTQGAIAHYEPITDFGFEHGLFMIHTPTTDYVVTSFNKTDMSMGLYDTANENDYISGGLYLGYLKPDVNNIFS